MTMTKPAAAPQTEIRPFTGWHMTAILVAFFGVVVLVNFTMASLASRTFGGEVVKNSYVASQHFNRWLDEAEKEKALGWQVEAARNKEGRVELSLSGLPKGKTEIIAHASHPLGVAPPQDIVFTQLDTAHFVSTKALPKGRWRLRIEVEHQGQTFSTEQELP